MKLWIKPTFLLALALLMTLYLGEDKARLDTQDTIKCSLILAIKGYKKWISPAGAPSCHFYPSCSIYTKEAIEEHGIITGLLMGFDRLTRCHKDTLHYPTVWVNDQVKNLDRPY